MKCNRCGKENGDGDKFCAFCGQRLDNNSVFPEEGEVNADLSERPPRAGGRKKFLIAAVIAVIVLAAAAAAFILSKKEQEKEYRDLCEKGNRYLEQMDYQQAADSYLAAIEIEPQEPELYIGLADAYTGLEDMEQARENYRKAIKLDAGRPDAYTGLVNSYIGDNPNPSYEDPDDTVSEIISEAQENVAEEDRESFDELEFWYEDYERYLAYQKIVDEHEKSSSGYSQRGTWLQVYGMALTKLVDFDGNGTDEFVIVYTESEYDVQNPPAMVTDYVLEVWAYENGELVQLFGGTPVMTNGGASYVQLLEKDGKSYIWAAGEDGTAGPYGYDGENFAPADLPDSETGGEVYVLEGTVSMGYAENLSAVYPAYSIRQSTAVELTYRITAGYWTLASLLSSDEDTAPEGAVAYGGYIQDSGNDMYIYSYNKDGGSRLEIDYYSESQRPAFGGEGRAVFLFNEETEEYEPEEQYSGSYDILSVEIQDEDHITVSLGSTESSYSSIPENDLVRDPHYSIFAAEEDEADSTQTQETQTKEAAGSEEELHQAFLEAAGTSQELYFFYDDFDADGVKEAFGITGSGSELYSDVQIYFINSEGEAEAQLQQPTTGYLMNGDLLKAGGCQFLVWENSGGGSGSTSSIFGVRDGEVYEPEISGKYMTFQQEGERYVGYVSDFSTGHHEYIAHGFAFNPTTGEFVEK